MLDAAVTCNPVSNAPCDGAGDEACDFNESGGTECFPPPNSVDICKPCGPDDGRCKAGMTCYEGVCAKFCCDKNDCGGGAICDTEIIGDSFGPCMTP